MSQADASEDNNDRPHRRRVRYSGTHPKRFAEKYKEHAIDAHPDLREHLREKGKTPAGTHIPIMVEQVMTALRPAPGDSVADCTLGYGGHAAEFARRIGTSGKLVGLDVDQAELERTRQRLTERYPNVPMAFCRSNFAGLAGVMQAQAPHGFNVIFADIGLSSMQIDDPDRGMSYRQDGPLDMRMDDRKKQTAADFLNTLPEETLSQMLWELADEPDHRLIARQIVLRRSGQPFKTIRQLVELVLDVKGLTIEEYKHRQRQNPGGLHPAARTFQAVRIHVNDELGALKQLLRTAPDCLCPGGRIGIICFHSGEDRLVKQAFAAGRRDGHYQSVADEVISPTRDEIAANSRSASAKFRWAVKTL